MGVIDCERVGAQCFFDIFTLYLKYLVWWTGLENLFN